MSPNEKERNQLSRQDKAFVMMRSIMDYGMGILWVSMGVFLIFIQYFSPNMATRFDDPAMKAFGAVCIIYGIFRIYRGYKKNYFRER
jgi:hypothetical protein